MAKAAAMPTTPRVDVAIGVERKAVRVARRKATDADAGHPGNLQGQHGLGAVARLLAAQRKLAQPQHARRPYP
eukprot:scaffold232840_cov27-Tisochrysis_lutea.AAC.2